MKLIIAGSRNITPTYIELDYFLKRSGFHPSMIVNGMHWEGVDKAAWTWAKERGFDRVGFPANWKHRGKGGGPYRNKLMAQFGSELLLVWDGRSSGSKSMLDAAFDRGLPCEVFMPHRGAPIRLHGVDPGVPMDGWYQYSFEGRII